MDDYSAFKWENIQRDFRGLIDKVQRETGATDAEVTMALGVVARRFINTNFLEEPNARDRSQYSGSPRDPQEAA